MDNSTENGNGSVKRNDKRTGFGVGFSDLNVYQNSYKGMLVVFKKILPILPKEERYDLCDQLRRSVKAIPRLIGEGHSKRHQNRGFQKYIDDAHAESNETIVSIHQVKDLYGSNEVKQLCIDLIDLYDKISRQLYKLALSWNNYHNSVDRKRGR